MVKRHMSALAFMFVSSALPGRAWPRSKPARRRPREAGRAPDAKTLLASVAKAMGADSVKTIQYTGSGSNAGIGQNRTPGRRLAARQGEVLRPGDRLCRALASRAQIVRVQGGTEQKQEQTILPTRPWGQQYDVWLSPFAFLKGAMANNTTIEPRQSSASLTRSPPSRCRTSTRSVATSTTRT